MYGLRQPETTIKKPLPPSMMVTILLAGLAITRNYRVNFSQAQFCSVLSEIFTVFLNAHDANIGLRNLSEGFFVACTNIILEL